MAKGGDESQTRYERLMETLFRELFDVVVLLLRKPRIED